MNLAENLDRTARARGRFPALRLGDEVTTFGEVDSWSRRVSGFLAGHGIRPGDRVALLIPDVWEFAVLYYGILRLGAVVVPLDSHLSERGVRHRLRDSGSRALVVWTPREVAVRPAARALGVVVWALEPSGLPALLADAAVCDLVEPRTADDLAVIAYTAGTTGEPRGAALTHDNLLRNCEVVVNDLLQLTSEDVVLGGLALSHPFGQTLGLNAAVRAGACLVLLGRWDAGAVLDTLSDQAITVLEGPPTVYDEVLHDPRHTDHDLLSLRICVSGGAAMPTDVQLRFEEAFHCLVLEAYGLAETSPLAGFNRRDRRRVGSVGVPATGVELRVVDDTGSEVGAGEPGEIVVRGPNVMSGYWGHPEQTAETVVDGWLHTGDVGVQDEDGFFFVVDRLQELITRDGRRVFPREVEGVLHEHEAVADAAVIGVPHPELGEEVHAVVTLRPGASTTSRELRDFVRRRVRPHTYPREVDIVEQMPKSSTGEILKRAIRLESRA